MKQCTIVLAAICFFLMAHLFVGGWPKAQSNPGTQHGSKFKSKVQPQSGTRCDRLGAPEEGFPIAELLHMEGVGRESPELVFLAHDYGYLIHTGAEEKVDFYVYNKPGNAIFHTTDFDEFFARLSAFPEEAKVDRISGCAISALGLSEAQSDALAELGREKRFRYMTVQDGNFPICTCATKECRFYERVKEP